MLKPVATSKGQQSLGFQVSEYMEKHRTAKCGEPHCRFVVMNEVSLGLPEDPYERADWYESQKEIWKPWEDGRSQHRWRWAVAKCHHCEVTALGITAGKKHLCAQWCLNTSIPEYPTGFPRGYLLWHKEHSENCTSHSWSETSESTENLSEMLSQWQHTMSLIRSSYTSSSKGKAKKNRKSSNAGRSPNSVLPSRKLPGFSIPKKSS